MKKKALNIQCPKCRKEYEIPEELYNKDVRCSCGYEFHVTPPIIFNPPYIVSICDVLAGLMIAAGILGIIISAFLGGGPAGIVISFVIMVSSIGPYILGTIIYYLARIEFNTRMIMEKEK